MSFILEALKKSDRERHQQKSTPKDVRRRTLTVTTKRSSRHWHPWLLLIIVIVLIGAGWWSFTKTAPSPMVAAEYQDQPKPVAAKAIPSEPPAVIVEPAPLPRHFSESPPSPHAVPQASGLAENTGRQQSPPPETQASEKQRVQTTTIARAEPHAIEDVPQTIAAPEYPLYEDLPRELRNRMPDINMSMHFFTDDPGRRLVRINNRLMHEGDLVSQDLQIIEIIPTGVVLDYLGKSFELSNLRQ